MKIQLEKPAVNISKLTGGKNEKVRRGGGGGGGVYMKNFGWIYGFMFCLQETSNGNQNN